MLKKIAPFVVLLLLVGLLYSTSRSRAFQLIGSELDRAGPVVSLDKPSVYFLAALEPDSNDISREAALLWIRNNWSDRLMPYFIESYRFASTATSRSALTAIVTEKTSVPVGSGLDEISQYSWSLELENLPDYALFKQILHRRIDPKFERYFEPSRRFDIRLDEISWGGVRQDGIPPLRGPKMLQASVADYLEDSHVVFGIEINGDARAYPQRILAWHEMFVDTVGGVPVAGVYCTLCGTVIIYHTRYEGVDHALGTSGFLYRSNKLMYDQATQSLWSTLEGKPVVGPLVGKGIELGQSSVVTTTWGEWKKRHPDTQVLSLDTGHRRDYGEGVAYRSYFSTDRRMFETPYHDTRLSNKSEILALRFLPEAAGRVVVAADFLSANPIYHGSYEDLHYVILTDASGANRVYERPAGITFDHWDQSARAEDSTGREWALSEASLVSDDGTVMERLNAHRAFWFGWQGAFPDTKLIM